MKFPAMCPDVPVADLATALAYYRDRRGFNIDWSADGIGLACVSRGATRMFLSNEQFRAPLGVRGPILLWLNLDGREEMDELHREWQAVGARLSGPLAAHPDAKLYEFFAEDLDGNFIRVFYDYAWEEREGAARPRAASAGRAPLDFCASLRDWAAFRSPATALSFPGDGATLTGRRPCGSGILVVKAERD